MTTKPTPKWILDAVHELGLVTAHHDSDDVAAKLAPVLINNLPQTALLTLADVACHRAQLDGIDARACAADLVKSMLDVLAAGDTESGELRGELEGAWLALSSLGAPMGDEGRVFTLVDRIRWLGNERDVALDDGAKAEAEVRDLEAKLEAGSKAYGGQVALVAELRARVAELEAKLEQRTDQAANALLVTKALHGTRMAVCNCNPSQYEADDHLSSCPVHVAEVELERVLTKVGA